MSQAENFLQDAVGSEDRLIVPVDPSDLKNVWKMQRELAAEFPGQNVSIGPETFRDACTPGANVTAVCYRVGILQVLDRSLNLLTANLPARVKDVVFNVAAKFPLKPMEVGVVYNGPPLGVEGFVNQLSHDLGVE